MKKRVCFIIMALLLFMPLGVFAQGYFTVSPANITMKVGETKNIAVSAVNSAGKLTISSNSVSASVNALAIFLDNDTQNLVVTGHSVGTAVITITATENFGTYDEEILAGQTKTVIVTVVNNTQQNNTNTQTVNTSPNTVGTTTSPTPEEIAEQEKDVALSKARILTEASARSLQEEDYNAAIEAVIALEDSEEKNALLKDLEDVRFKIAVNNATSNCINTDSIQCDCPKESIPKKWVLLAGLALLLCIVEFIYIVSNKNSSRKKHRDEDIQPVVIKPIEAAKIEPKVKEEKVEEVKEEKKSTKKKEVKKTTKKVEQKKEVKKTTKKTEPKKETKTTKKAEPKKETKTKKTTKKVEKK